MQQTRGHAGATAAAAVLGVLLLAVLGSWAASTGPGGLFRGEGPRAETDTAGPLNSDPTSRESADVAQPQSGSDADWGWLRTIVATIVELVLLAIVTYGLYRGGRWAARQAWSWRRQRRDPRQEEATFDVLADPTALAEELVLGAARQRVLLEEGSPRNGIVRCWHEFEVSAARVGLARKPWQTPAEYTLFILDLVEAEHGAVSVLADRYREARFSDHPVTEADRAAALAALDQIHADIASSTGVRR